MKFLSTGIFIGFSLLLVISGCKKDDEGLTPQEQFDEDIMIIEDYLQDHNLVAEKTASGLHYIITEEGTGEYPPLESTVTVKYKGYLTDGTIFDQTSPANVLTHPLSQFIAGWTEGLQLLKSGGGKGTFLIPSALGYGPNPIGSIPANSVLIFDVTLLDFE